MPVIPSKEEKILERKAKLDELRKKMVCLSLLPQPANSIKFQVSQAASSRANRSSLVEEAAKAKITARDAARLERQRKLAEMLRTKADAEERGEDVERQKNWEYTIEENEEWEKKLARKKRRADFEFHGRLLSTFFSNLTHNITNIIQNSQMTHMQHEEDTRKIWTSLSLTLSLIINRKRLLWDKQVILLASTRQEDLWRSLLQTNNRYTATVSLVRMPLTG